MMVFTHYHIEMVLKKNMEVFMFGFNLAGYNDSNIAPMFKDSPKQMATEGFLNSGTKCLRFQTTTTIYNGVEMVTETNLTVSVSTDEEKTVIPNDRATIKSTRSVVPTPYKEYTEPDITCDLINGCGDPIVGTYGMVDSHQIASEHSSRMWAKPLVEAPHELLLECFALEAWNIKDVNVYNHNGDMTFSHMFFLQLERDMSVVAGLEEYMQKHDILDVFDVEAYQSRLDRVKSVKSRNPRTTGKRMVDTYE